MTEKDSVRIDKYLWAVRIYKTRSLASDACRMGRILINNFAAKPSRMIEGGELITVKKPPVIFTFKIKIPIENRVSAKLVPLHLEDLTPESEKLKVAISRSGAAGLRQKGSGRPTKKERRIIDRWQDDYNGN
ncbi:MAG: RNA-binding S4 domain-containing protein [Bacteroidales bacterium]|jgi:ribosome-associated heat shock protein Hsp15|nr:RNA-binding S4 domain-containing protein [Bacteroidales bacterium]